MQTQCPQRKQVYWTRTVTNRQLSSGGVPSLGFKRCRTAPHRHVNGCFRGKRLHLCLSPFWQHHSQEAAGSRVGRRADQHRGGGGRRAGSGLCGLHLLAGQGELSITLKPWQCSALLWSFCTFLHLQVALANCSNAAASAAYGEMAKLQGRKSCGVSGVARSFRDIHSDFPDHASAAMRRIVHRGDAKARPRQPLRRLFCVDAWPDKTVECSVCSNGATSSAWRCWTRGQRAAAASSNSTTWRWCAPGAGPKLLPTHARAG